jgi:hypothetical protein
MLHSGMFRGRMLRLKTDCGVFRFARPVALVLAIAVPAQAIPVLPSAHSPIPQTPFPAVTLGGEGGSGHGARSRRERALVLRIRIVSVALSRDNMKVGNFSVSFVDLEVPVAGLPIRLTRTYDSREHQSGDFGFGWRLDVSRVQVSLAEQSGFGWYGTVAGIQFPTYCLQPTTSHPVTITLPDGKVYEFDAAVSPQCQGGAPIAAGTVSFVPRPGTIATLAPLGGTDVDVFGSWPGTQDVTQGAATYDPQGYVLTLPDGRSFTIDKQQGLQTIADTNGNSLFVSPGGILSSTGKGVTFQRDGAGRIQQMLTRIDQRLV